MGSIELNTLTQQLFGHFGAIEVMPNTFSATATTRKIFNNKNMLKLFNNEELIESAKLFLKYDLNITEASKNGYMHRNTLIYRLDCIEKLTGLDIRKFEHAVVFNNIIIAYEQLTKKH